MNTCEQCGKPSGNWNHCPECLNAIELSNTSPHPRYDALVASVQGGKTLDGADGVTCEEDYQDKCVKLIKELEKELSQAITSLVEMAIAGNAEMMRQNDVIESLSKQVELADGLLNSRDLVREHFRACPNCEPVGCCNGQECGCQGQPVDFRVTDKCGDDCFGKIWLDKKRMDWIEANRVQLNCMMGAPGSYHYQVGSHPSESSFRAAIDARMKLSEK